MQFLRNAWYMAMWSQDLQLDELEHRIILGEPLVFFRKQNGDVAALLDQCPHRFAPLHKGKLCGDQIRCGYHGLEFDASGSCVKNPHGDGRIASGLKVDSYTAVEKHTMVWVWMGSGEPDSSLIPDYRIFDEDSGYQISKRDYLTMSANYELITDNLLDLSHVSFLHDGILGNEDTIDAAIEVEQKGDTLYVTRLMSGVRPPGMFDLLYLRDGKPVDVWFTMRWDVPCCMLNDAGVTKPGGTKEQGTGIFGAHILTPATETSTRYHFAAARQNPIQHPDELDAEIKQQLSQLRRYAFEQQDEPMITAQQEAYTRNGGLGSISPTLFSIDVGPVKAGRILQEKIRQENNQAEVGVSSARSSVKDEVHHG